MKRKAWALLLAILLALPLGLSGCAQGDEEAPNFSGYRDVAELATLECYYHNVAEIYNPGTDYLFGLIHKGYKKVWFEYRGSVSLGIDVNRVSISEPDEEGVVTITMPYAAVIGLPKVDETSFSDMYSDTGLLGTITAEEQTQALDTAQNAMLEQAQNDESLKRQATERAKVLLEEYVKNVGDAIGKSYTVRFEMLPAEEE